LLKVLQNETYGVFAEEQTGRRISASTSRSSACAALSESLGCQTVAFLPQLDRLHSNSNQRSCEQWVGESIKRIKLSICHLTDGAIDK
jgi:hypothetical protein